MFLNLLKQHQKALYDLIIGQTSVKQQKFVKEYEKYCSFIEPPQKEQTKKISIDAYQGKDIKINTSTAHKLFELGKVGCLILAGGEGSRLTYHKPKGCYPISPFRHKSLFEIFLSKIKACCDKYGSLLPTIIICSEKTLSDVKKFLKEHSYFGLHKDYVHVISQPSIPYFSLDGTWILDEDKILCGPNGNAGILQALDDTHLLDDLIEQNVDHLMMIPIDNPLADPFDIDLISMQEDETLDAVFRCIPYRNGEAIGVIGKTDRLVIIDYNSLSQSSQKNFHFANTNIFCFSSKFLRHVAKQSLPYHWVEKSLTYQGKKHKVLKGEIFITDILNYTHASECLVSDREDVFCPLKTSDGPSGIQAVKDAMITKDCRLLSKLLGYDVQNAIELNPKFYYPTQHFLQLCKMKNISSGYIDL